MTTATTPRAPEARPDLSRLRIARDDVASAPRRRRGGGVAWALLVVLVGAAGWAWRSGRLVWRPEGGAGPETVETALVSTDGGVAAGTPAPREERANGYVVARRRAALSTVLSGRLVEVNVTEGQRVEKDFVVARIQHDDYDAAKVRAGLDVDVALARREELRLAQDAGRLDLARIRGDVAVLDDLVRQAGAEAERAAKDLERNEPLRGRVIDGATWDRMTAAASAASASLDAARARVRAGASAVASAEGELLRRDGALATADAEVLRAREAAAEAAILVEKTFVRAPFAGIVIRKDAEVGEVVAATGAGGNSRGSVATIVDPTSLEVQVEPSETRLERIREGDRADVILEASSRTRIPGRVRQLWPTADRQKATVEIRIALETIPEILRPDMGVLVVFLGAEAAKEPAPGVATRSARPSVPKAAVVVRDGRPVVFVVDGETARRRPVTLGDERGDRVDVIDGLVGGERVVLSPGARIDDGASVRGSR